MIRGAEEGVPAELAADQGAATTPRSACPAAEETSGAGLAVTAASTTWEEMTPPRGAGAGKAAVVA